MCANGHAATVSTEANVQVKDPAAFAADLAELKQALQARRVDPVCMAYMAVRRHAAGAGLIAVLRQVEAALGPPTLPAIVSAFSHRRCFMCQDGTSPCPTCKGTGMIDRFNCPACDGLGAEPCTFCLGTGWNDRAQVPPELKKFVHARQIAHVEKDIQSLPRLTHQLRQLGPAVPAEVRRKTAAWLFRLQGRLANLAATEPGSELAGRYGPLAAECGGLIEGLRSHTPSAGDSATIPADDGDGEIPLPAVEEQS